MALESCFLLSKRIGSIDIFFSGFKPNTWLDINNSNEVPKNNRTGGSLGKKSGRKEVGNIMDEMGIVCVSQLKRVDPTVDTGRNKFYSASWDRKFFISRRFEALFKKHCC